MCNFGARDVSVGLIMDIYDIIGRASGLASTLPLIITNISFVRREKKNKLTPSV
jgi:hypothetical protein